MLTVREVMERLKKEKITSSEQVVRVWIREGRLPATLNNGNRKRGYRIHPNDLKLFIETNKRVPLGLLPPSFSEAELCYLYQLLWKEAKHRSTTISLEKLGHKLLRHMVYAQDNEI